jgi:4-diphosphocytidyl-2-C-methyl-D-erythritol kinase
MQTVSLEDEVVVRLTDQHGGVALHCDDPSLATDHTNLVYRAAIAALPRPQRVGLDIMLRKRIPMGAGLGGGSSDAAATILAVDRLLDGGRTPEELAQIGQTLGSDVPFFFAAPAAIVKGRGEQVQAVPLTGSRWIVLVYPGFPVETKWAYHTLASSRTEILRLSAIHADLEAASALSWMDLVKVMENDFEAPVFAAHPRLRRVKDELSAAGAEAALLSGSGATVFGVFSDSSTAEAAAQTFREDPRLRVFVARTGSGSLLCRPPSVPA